MTKTRTITSLRFKTEKQRPTGVHFKTPIGVHFRTISLYLRLRRTYSVNQTSIVSNYTRFLKKTISLL